MNKATRERLEANPHYKLSPQQKKEIKEMDLEEERTPMVEFGAPPLHQNGTPEFETHPTSVVKRKRSNTNE